LVTAYFVATHDFVAADEVASATLHAAGNMCAVTGCDGLPARGSCLFSRHRYSCETEKRLRQFYVTWYRSARAPLIAMMAWK
jgi:hypothetical protein